MTDYLQRAGLLESLNALRFNLVGYGCTTCIGNSGPLDDAVASRVEREDLAVCAVLSGNRKFEGRIPRRSRRHISRHRRSWSRTRWQEPFAGTSPPNRSAMDATEYPVMLADIWPTSAEIAAAMEQGLGRDLYDNEYERVFAGDEHWQQLPSPTGAMFEWEDDSTYVREPNFFQDLSAGAPAGARHHRARVFALLGDSITTDHISPAGSISPSSPAAAYLSRARRRAAHFNTYGARRGNHEVMVRGTFANIRLRNSLRTARRAVTPSTFRVARS